MTRSRGSFLDAMRAVGLVVMIYGLVGLALPPEADRPKPPKPPELNAVPWYRSLAWIGPRLLLNDGQVEKEFGVESPVPRVKRLAMLWLSHLEDYEDDGRPVGESRRSKFFLVYQFLFPGHVLAKLEPWERVWLEKLRDKARTSFGHFGPETTIRTALRTPIPLEDTLCVRDNHNPAIAEAPHGLRLRQAPRGTTRLFSGRIRSLRGDPGRPLVGASGGANRIVSGVPTSRRRGPG